MWWLEIGSAVGPRDGRRGLPPQIRAQELKVAGSSTGATSLSRVGAAIGAQVQPMGRQCVPALWVAEERLQRAARVTGAGQDLPPPAHASGGLFDSTTHHHEPIPCGKPVRGRGRRARRGSPELDSRVAHGAGASVPAVPIERTRSGPRCARW